MQPKESAESFKEEYEKINFMKRILYIDIYIHEINVKMKLIY